MPYIPDHPYRIVITGSSGSGRTNPLVNLLNDQRDIDKIYLYAKYPYEVNINFSFSRCKKVSLKHCDNPKAFIEYSKYMQNVYKCIDEYNPGERKKILIVCDYRIGDMISKNKVGPLLKEPFIRERKLSISLVFIRQSYFKVPKGVRLDFTNYFTVKILSKRELQQIAMNHSSDIGLKACMKIHKKCTAKKKSFLVKDTTLPSDKSLRFRQNHFERI